MMAAYELVCHLHPSTPAIEASRQEDKTTKEKQYSDLEKLQQSIDPNSKTYHTKMLKLMYDL